MITVSNMHNNVRNRLVVTVNILLFFLVTIFYLSDIADISIGNATPMILLPLLTAFSWFSTTKKAAFTGFLVGGCIDSVAHDSYCFNTITFMLIGVFVCLAANNIFNKNGRAAMVMSLITSVVYFTLNWAFFHAFGTSVEESFAYLLRYAIPSAVYTAVFIIPFYYLYKLLEKYKAQ